MTTILLAFAIPIGIIAGIFLGIWLATQAIKYAIGRGLGW